MELLIHRPEMRASTQIVTGTITIEAQALRVNLENHLQNKVKISFLPNQYYNDKIYILDDYVVNENINGLDITFRLKEGDINITHKIEEVVKLETREYFNRTEYKAYTSVSDVYEEAYNFCLYF